MLDDPEHRRRLRRRSHIGPAGPLGGAGLLLLADLSAARTAASHLRLVPGQPARLSQRVLGPSSSSAHARGCLLDDAAELRDLLAELTGAEITIDVSDSVLEVTDETWAQRDR